MYCLSLCVSILVRRSFECSSKTQEVKRFKRSRDARGQEICTRGQEAHKVKRYVQEVKRPKRSRDTRGQEIQEVKRYKRSRDTRGQEIQGFKRTNQPAFSYAWRSLDPSNTNKIGRTEFPYIRTDGVELTNLMSLFRE